MFSRLATIFVFAWSAIFASATLTIIAPSSSYWWVANSQNLYSWTCGSQNNEGYTNFTVMINNASPTVFSGPLALVAIQWDYDCSVLLPPVASLPAGSGYTLYFANVFNDTDIIASSSVFEIKPEGSAYAPQPSGASSATVTASVTGSASAASSTSTSTKKSSAVSTSHVAFSGLAGALALLGAVMML